MTKIGSNVFQYCTLLSEIRFPPSLSSIGQGIFSGLSNLKTIEFSSNSHNLTTLITSEYSFCNIRSSFSFITNNRSISFQDNAFYNSAIVQLDFNFDQDITFSGSVFNCSKYLDSITIPDCITSITSTLFTECSSLRCIIFSPYSRLCSIESYSFSNTSIRTLYVPQQVQEIGSDIFNSSIISPVIYYAGASTSISSYSITSTIYVSNEYPGSIYQNMIKVSNKIINSKAYHCDVEPEETTLIYDNIKYSIIDNEKKEVIVIPDAYSSSSMSIPQSFTIGYIKYTVVGIKRCAFYNNRILNQITLSRELRFIEEYAFFNCTNLRYIYDLYAQSIGRYAFYGCKIITLSINSWNYIIGDYAFANCTDLEQISGTSQNDNYPREIGKYAFADCIKLTEAPCLDYVYCIHKGAFRNTSISSINIKKYTEIIEEGAFASCMKLSMFDAHNNNILTSISDDCFKDCVELKYVFLPEIIESIGNYSFFGCTKLYYINLYKVGSIGYHAFYDSPCFMVEFNGTIEPQFNSSFMCTNQKFYSDTYKSTSFCGICIANDCKCPDTKPKATNIPAKRYFCENQRILRLKF